MLSSELVLSLSYVVLENNKLETKKKTFKLCDKGGTVVFPTSKTFYTKDFDLCEVELGEQSADFANIANSSTQIQLTYLESAIALQLQQKQQMCTSCPTQPAAWGLTSRLCKPAHRKS